MKVSEIVKAYNSLVKFQNKYKEKKLPSKVSFIIARDVKKMQDVVDDFEEKKNEALREYGEKDDDGQLVIGNDNSVKIIDQDKFWEDVNAVLDTDIEMHLERLTMADLEKCDQEGYEHLDVEDAMDLECILEEEDKV